VGYTRPNYLLLLLKLARTVRDFLWLVHWKPLLLDYQGFFP
jgi:hypothetical protein